MFGGISVHVSSRMQKPEDNLGWDNFSSAIHQFFETKSLTVWILPSRLDWWARKPRRSTGLHYPSTKITGRYDHVQLKNKTKLGSGNQTLFLLPTINLVTEISLKP